MDCKATGKTLVWGKTERTRGELFEVPAEEREFYPDASYMIACEYDTNEVAVSNVAPSKTKSPDGRDGYRCVAKITNADGHVRTLSRAWIVEN